jgi:hypothetical protein
VSAVSKVSERMAETGEWLERTFFAVVLVAGVAVLVVVTVCLLTLMAAGTFATLHPGDDFDFGGEFGSSIILPALPFQ